MNDIDRLIDEKRQLEQEIEQKSEVIMRLERHARESRASENINISNYQGLRKRSNSPSVMTATGNSTVGIQQFATKGNQDLIIKEKESYISKLEKELNDMRRENERLKDRLIMYELQNFEHGPPA